MVIRQSQLAALSFVILLSLVGECFGVEGSPDSFFASGQLNIAVRAVAAQADGKLIISGAFTITRVGGFVTKGVARLHTDGSIDESFKAELSGYPFEVRALCVQPDGKILVGGQFSAAGATPRGNIVRLLSNGSLDSDFAGGLPGCNGTVIALALQPDGKIIVGGSFTTMHGQARGRVCRLNPDGTLDEFFASGLSGAAGTVAAVLIQPDGKTVIAGYFLKVNDTNKKRIARLNLDGSLDGNFRAAAEGDVLGLALQANGGIFLVGVFDVVSGQQRGGIARLNTDGTLDTDFDASANGKVSTVLAQRYGNILVGGEFTAIDSIPMGRIARLTSAGLLDSTFAKGAGANSYIDDILQQADGKIVVVGDFTTIGGMPRQRVARLEAALPRDVTPPTIVLNGNNPMTVPFASGFVDPGARVVDDSDAERTIFGSGAVNTGQAGTYTLTYVASDAAGNAATPVVRTVVVLPAPPDRTAPTIVLLGDNPMTVMLRSVFTDPGAKVVDDRDDERTIPGSGSVNTDQSGTYTLTYAASDLAGNAAAPVVRTVHVTAISMLKPLKDSLTIKSGKKGKAVILLSNNTRAKVPKAKEEGELEIEVLSGAGLVTVPGKLPFKAAHKSRDTSPPKITRVNLIVTAATGQTGQATLVIRYKGRTAQLNVTVK